MVIKGHGKSEETLTAPKPQNAKFLSKSKTETGGSQYCIHSAPASVGTSDNTGTKSVLSAKDIQVKTKTWLFVRFFDSICKDDFMYYAKYIEKNFFYDSHPKKCSTPMQHGGNINSYRTNELKFIHPPLPTYVRNGYLDSQKILHAIGILFEIKKDSVLYI